MRALEPFVGEFLYTHVDREGLMQGTDMAAIRAVRDATHADVTAAGGITTTGRNRPARCARRRRRRRNGALYEPASALMLSRKKSSRTTDYAVYATAMRIRLAQCREPPT